MQKISIQKSLTAFIIYKPVFVCIAGLLGIPSFAFVVFALCLAIFGIIKSQIIKKRFVTIFFICTVITFNLFSEIRMVDEYSMVNEYIYNVAYSLLYLLTLILICKRGWQPELSVYWQYSLFFVLFFCVVENYVFA